MWKNNQSLIIFLCVAIVVTVVARLIPHIPNTAPIAALALFSGFQTRSIWGIFVPLGALFATDLILGFYETGVMFSVYASFVLIYALGYFSQAGAGKLRVFGNSIAGSTLFFILTNLAVWKFSAMYPETIEGLLLCYTLALPFFAYTLLGDLFWNGAFSGGYAFYRKTLLNFSPIQLLRYIVTKYSIYRVFDFRR